jgi:hypothetical protein
MKKNVGTIDRVIRLIIALAIFIIAYIYHSWWGLVGLIPLLTSLIGWCPVYALLGIRTCKVEPEQKVKPKKKY